MHILSPTQPDPRDLRIVSDHRADSPTIALLAPGVEYSRRAAAGLLLDLRPHVAGQLEAVTRSGVRVPMDEEIATVQAIRRHVLTPRGG